MTSEPLLTRWKQGLIAIGGIVRRGFAQFAGFEVFFRVLGAAVFAPLTAWLTAQLIARSGSGAVSNYDLAGFFLSVNGLVYLAVVVTITFALLFFDFGGLTALAIALQREDRIRLPQLFRWLGLSLPRLWRLSVRQFLVYFAHAVPFLAVTGGAYLAFLTKSDINYYLSVKPPAFWYAVAIAGTAGLVFAFFAVRLFIDWIYSVPLLLLTEASPRESMKESRRLAQGRRREVILMLVGWGAAVVVLLVCLWLLMAGLKFVLLGLAGRQVGLVLTMTAVLTVVQFLFAAALGIVAMSALACAVARSFVVLRPEVQLPESLSGDEVAILRRVVRVLRAGWAIVLLFLAFTAWAAVELLDRVQLEDTTTVTAHRGSSITAPENTMAAILLAVEEGTDYVEIDVQETKDGKVVLVHDKDLKRVFDIDKGIWEVTYDEIRDLDSGGWFSPDFSDQRIATLAQVIEAVKGWAKLNIELKFSGHEKQLASEVVRIVNEHDFMDQCILTSLDYAGIGRVRDADSNARTGLIVTSVIGDLFQLEGDLFSVSASSITRDLIARAHQKGLEVHAWTVNDVPLMNTLIGMGVDSIITDDPKLLREVLEGRADLSNAEKVLLQLAEFANGR